MPDNPNQRLFALAADVLYHMSVAGVHGCSVHWDNYNRWFVFELTPKTFVLSPSSISTDFDPAAAAQRLLIAWGLRA